MTTQAPKRILYFLTCATIFLIGSCADEGITEESPRVTLPEPQEIVNCTLYGQVIDEQGVPISGAQVVYRSGLAPLQLVTNEEGYFLIPEVENKGAAAFVSVSSPGKFEAFRRFSLVPNRQNYTEIKMLDREMIGSISSPTGGTLNQTNGASIELPANGIVDNMGAPYTGEVSVAMAWIDPSAEDLAQRMIGDLSGIDEVGTLRSLSSMGMLQVELIGSDGSILNLDEGANATLTFPIPIALRNHATPTIPLWSYNEVEGIWVQEGEAYREGNAYIGDVSHFSSWNVDFMTDPIEITGVVNFDTQTEEGNNIVGGSFLQIYVCSELFGRKGGWLCEDGSFRLYNFPKDESFELKVLDRCNETVFSETFGPFSSDQDLGEITVSQSETFTVQITGNALNCEGDPVTDGFVTVSQGENRDQFPLNDDGSFEIGYVYCDGPDIGVEVTDLIGLQMSEELIIENGETTAVFEDVSVCEEVGDIIFLDAESLGQFTFLEDIFVSNRISRNDNNIRDLYITANLEGGELNVIDFLGIEGFLMHMEIPSDYKTNPNFDINNVPVNGLFMRDEDSVCEGFEQSVTISVTASFSILEDFPGRAEGSFNGSVNCIDDNSTTFNLENISGFFRVPSFEQ